MQHVILNSPSDNKLIEQLGKLKQKYKKATQCRSDQIDSFKTLPQCERTHLLQVYISNELYVTLTLKY